MKTLVIIIVLLLGGSLCSIAQGTIEVSFDKQVLLVFPFEIKERGWGVGDRENVGVTVNGAKVLLQAKSSIGFAETNFFAELVDGSFYSMDLKFNNKPAKTFFVYTPAQALHRNEVKDSRYVESPRSSPVEKEVSKTKQSAEPEPGSVLPTEGMGGIAEKVSTTADYLSNVGTIDIPNKITLYVGGIYIFDGRLYFKVNIRNKSNIPYSINYGEFVVKTVGKGLKSGSETSERKHIQSLFNPELGLIVNDDQDIIYETSFGEIKGKSTLTIVYVFDKFTIADNKQLFIRLWEKNGERTIELPIDSDELLKAKSKL